MNTYAPIINLPTDQISLDFLLDTGRISLEDAEKMANTEDEHTHSETLKNCVHKSDYFFDHILLSEFFRELPYEIYRVKGFIHLASDPEKTFLVQKVGARFTIKEIQNPPKEKQNILVFI